jgi:hypothetical protein
MNELYDDYYWYDKEKDTVIKCDKTKYREFLKKNNGVKDAIKYDKFNLASDNSTVSTLYGAKEYVVSTVCLPFCEWENPFSYVRISDRPLIFETIVFENKSILYEFKNYCINQAKRDHDDMILRVIREI